LAQQVTEARSLLSLAEGRQQYDLTIRKFQNIWCAATFCLLIFRKIAVLYFMIFLRQVKKLVD